MKKIIVALCAIAMATAVVSCGKNKQENKYDPTKDGIVGEWVSEGTNVAPLMTALGFTRLTAEFKANNTYTAVGYDAQNAPNNMAGTYVITKSNVGNIYTIVLNQSSPTALTSEGILEVSKIGDDYVMKYEIVQVEPNIGATAPTAAGGFGSTNGGALGTINVQTYVRQ